VASKYEKGLEIRLREKEKNEEMELKVVKSSQDNKKEEDTAKTSEEKKGL
jgi:hypothetical protein